MKYKIVGLGVLVLLFSITAHAQPPSIGTASQRYDGCRGSFIDIGTAQRLLPLETQTARIHARLYGGRRSTIHFGGISNTVSHCYQQAHFGGTPAPLPQPVPRSPVIGTYGITNFFPDNARTRPPETCAISTGHGLLQDRDCDDIPNKPDNCPNRPNKLQRDQNRNGKGDACDIYIQSYTVQPQELSCGQSTLAKVRIVNNNNRPYSNVEARFAVKSLTETTQTIPVIKPGAARTVQLTARIPHNAAPGQHTATASLHYIERGRAMATGIARQLRVSDTACTQQVSANTTVQVREIEDAQPGKTAVYPMKITNPHDTAKSFQIDVEGIDFGTYSLNPGSVVLVEPGASRTVYLKVHTDKGVGTGSKSFTVEVGQGESVQQIMLVADIVEKDEQKDRTLYPYIAALIVLLGVAALAFYKTRFKNTLLGNTH